MKKTAVTLAVFAVLMAFSMTLAAEMETGNICTAVADRACEGAAISFQSDVGKVWAYTRILGMEEGGSITHRWIYKDRNMAEVKLNIGGSDWRTWSSKNIDSLWTGDWKVEIVDNSDGSVIDILEFTVGQ